MDNFTNTQSVRIAEIERRLDAIEHRLKSISAAAAAVSASNVGATGGTEKTEGEQ